MRTCRPTNARRLTDAGFSLVEVVVALMILALSVSVVAGVLISTMGVTRQNTQRVTAANLAQQQIEAVRSQRALDIVDGTTTPVSGLVIDGTTYTVTQNSVYLNAGATQSLCKETSNTIAYKRVTQTVTWPNMGSTKPVQADTVVSLGLNGDGLSAATGAAAVLVKGPTGQPVDGVAVSVSPGSLTQTTGADGCAVFVSLAPGSYQAIVQRPGFVGIDGAQQVVTAPFAVTAAQVVRPSVDYARRGALAVTLSEQPGHPVPTPLPMTLDFSLFTPQTTRVFQDCSQIAAAPQSCVGGTPLRTAQALYPGSYSAWAGSCADAKPTSVTATAVFADGTTPYVVPVAGVTVEVRDVNNAPVSGQTVYAIHQADEQCTIGVAWLLPGSGASRKVSLPQGLWTFTTSSTVTSTPPSGSATAQLKAGTVDPVAKVVTVP